MLEGIVFRSQLIIAWPIWAGGYPTREQALHVVEQQEPALIAMVDDRVRALLGSGFFTQELACQVGAYVPVGGLWPQKYVPNSLNLVIIVTVSSMTAQQSSNLTEKVSNVVEDLAGVVTALLTARMPGAREGANIYDVTSRWDPGPVLSYTESGESLEEMDDDSLTQPRVTRGLPTGKRSRVFISYAHKDARWLTRLQVHLMPLARYFGIDLWDDTKIASGMDWRTEIEDALGAAQVAILLISADFLASDFIAANELPPLLDAAENDGALILPVIVGPSMFLEVPSLCRYQAVNDPATALVNMSRGRQEKILNETAVRVKSHFEELAEDVND